MDALAPRKARTALKGILPPLVTPFAQDGEIDYAGVRRQIDFMVANKVHGVVVGGSTGEGHTLDREEFAELMRATHDAVGGRIPLVAGLIVNSTREAIKRSKTLKDLNVEALQLTPVHYLFKPDPAETIAHFKTIYEETGIPIFIYNVVPWNYLDVTLMLQIMAEVPGVIGIKQSSGDLKSISDLLCTMNPDNIVLTGVDALLYPAFVLGVHGAITALTAAVPGVCVQLWNAVKAGDQAKALDLHKRLNALWNVMTHDNLPACTKYIQHRQGMELYRGRAPMHGVSSEQQKRIDQALKALSL